MSPLAYTFGPITAAFGVFFFGVWETLLFSIVITALVPLQFAWGSIGKFLAHAHMPKAPEAAQRSLLRIRPILYALIIFTMIMGAGAALGPVLSAWALQSGELARAGLLLAVIQVGLLTGGIWCGTRGIMYSPTRLLLCSAGGCALLFLFGSLVSGLLFLILFCLLFGLLRSPSAPSVLYLTGSFAPPSRLGESNGLFSAAIYAGLAGGALLSGSLLSVFSLSHTLLIIGGMLFLASILAYSLHRRVTEIPSTEVA